MGKFRRIVSSEKYLQQLRQENDGLRRQLAERDKLLANIYKQLARLTEATVDWRNIRTHGISDG